MCAELIVREASLATHFGSMGSTLDTHIDRSAGVKLVADWDTVPLVAGLTGPGCEYVARNRGPNVPVAPVLLLESGLWVWVGYREEWDSERPAGPTRRFSFRSTGLTFHFGYRNYLYKPQMFRAEWAGWSRWNGIEYSYQAGDAAHPHWQIDALESLRRDDADEQVATLLAVIRQEEQEAEPRDFSPQFMESEVVSDLISQQELSRIHFASAAAWWKAVPDDTHAHSPTTVTDIRVWVDRTLKYVVRELTRLRA